MHIPECLDGSRDGSIPIQAERSRGKALGCRDTLRLDYGDATKQDPAAQYSAAQYSAAQYSTAQYSAAQQQPAHCRRDLLSIPSRRCRGVVVAALATPSGHRLVSALGFASRCSRFVLVGGPAMPRSWIADRIHRNRKRLRVGVDRCLGRHRRHLVPVTLLPCVECPDGPSLVGIGNDVRDGRYGPGDGHR